MKKITLLLLCGFIAIANFTKAQAPEILTTTHKINPEAIRLFNEKHFSTGQLGASLLGSFGDFIFVSEEIKNGVIITVYDKVDLHKVRDFKVNLQIDLYPGIFPFITYDIIDNNRITIIYTSFDKKTETISMHSKTIDFEGKIIAELKNIETMTRRASQDDFTFTSSPDKSKILAYFRNTYEEPQKNKIDLFLYDKNFKKISGKKIKFKYPGEQFMIEKSMVTNSGRIVIITSYLEKKEKKSDKDNRVFKIFGVSEENEELDEIEIGKDGTSIEKTLKDQYCLDSSNHLIIAGFFSKLTTKSGDGANGCFYSSINLTKWEKEVENFHLFTKDDYRKIYYSGNLELSEEKIEKNLDKIEGVENIFFRELHFDSAGNLKMETEIKYNVYKGGSQYDPGDQHYNQIIEFEFSSLGDLENLTVIPKAQLNGSHSMGFIPIYSSKRTYFVYNDNADNLKDDNEDKFKYEYKNDKNQILVYCYQKKDKIVKKRATEAITKNQTIKPYAEINEFKNGYIRIDNLTVITWAKSPKTGEHIILKISFIK